LKYLADTSLLVRTVHHEDPQSRIARGAIRKLAEAGHQLYILPQNTAEFWVVCTRPAGANTNGLGYGASRVLRYIARFEALFTVLYETDEVYREWKRLIALHSVTGRQAHDTRLAAAMIAHGVENIVTFNVSDFSRYPEITTLHPAKI
jgi:predicted nucleic acid-binding protein